MHLGAGIAPIDDAARVPKSPPRQRRCSGYITGIGLEEIELIGRVVVIGSAEKCQEYEENGACDKDEGGESEKRAWM